MPRLITSPLLLALVLSLPGMAPHVRSPKAFAATYRVSRGDDLFYNYYVGPAPMAGGVAAGMVPAPLPTPPLVGHTYITYEPFMPHEFLYKHSRSYHRHHPGRGWVSTKIHWW